MAYSAHADVASQLQRISGGFTASSSPTQTEATAFIALIDAEIDAKLASVGIVLPVVGATALAVLKQISVDGTAAMVLRSIQIEGDEAKERQRLYEEALAAIVANPVSLGATSGFTASSPAGSTAEDPRIFQRGTTQW